MTRFAQGAILNRNTAAFFWVQLLIAITAKWLVYLAVSNAWDPEDLSPAEQLNFNSQVNFFTDPQRATQNILINVGVVSKIVEEQYNTQYELRGS